MAEFEFVGDVSKLSEGQIKFIANVVQERGFKNVKKIDIQPLGKVGDNFAANVKRITVEKDSETLKMVAKVAPNNETLRAMGNTNVFFQNENIMYTQVLPKFTELEKAANIPKEERFRYAACYGTYMEEPNEIILLEDLGVPGFKILDKFTSLTDENVRLVLKNFAILHSLSYVLKHQEPETFKKFCNSLTNYFAVTSAIPEMSGWLNQVDDDVQLILNDDKYKKAVKNAAVQLIPNALKFDKEDTNSKHSVIQQGDSWTNNIMFRLEDDKTVECCFVDYQISHQSNPVADLHYMIFCSTDYATRKKHYYDWMDYYHSQLDKSLANFGQKANYVYPRDQFDADLRRTAKSFLGQVIMVASIILREPEDAAVFKDAMNSDDPNITIENLSEQTKLSATKPETLRKFKAKIEELVDSLIEFGYL